MDIEGASQTRAQAYKELGARIDRAATLQQDVNRLQMRKNLLGKGRRVKLQTTLDKFGDETTDAIPVYRWKLERKK